ncbi:MAG TPA: hypothetical protein PK625_10495 [Spirochaetales bacterium]|nr:hypothetical protein [Spirochaetales bacterium]
MRRRDDYLLPNIERNFWADEFYADARLYFLRLATFYRRRAMDYRRQLLQGGDISYFKCYIRIDLERAWVAVRAARMLRLEAWSVDRGFPGFAERERVHRFLMAGGFQSLRGLGVKHA